MGKKVAIIGAGIAGLSAGVYLRMNGYETEIFEMHTLPGGVCTAWKRKGYTFDGCIHWLIGSGESYSFHEVWKELHAVQGREFVEYEEFSQIELGSEKLTLYGDADMLRDEMLRIAPEDHRIIDRLIKDIKNLGKFELNATPDKTTFGKWVKNMITMIAIFPSVMRSFRVTVNEFIAKLKNPTLRAIFESQYAPDTFGDFSMIGFVLMMAGANAKSGGYPIGGSLEFARAIEKYYRELGGVIRYGETVEKIIVENDRAVGIVSNGKEYRADYVVSAADGYSTIYRMLEGKYRDEKIDKIYEEMQTFPPLIQISLGIAREFNDMPHRMSFELKKPIVLDLPKSEQNRMGVTFYNFDPTLAPTGKTSVVVAFATNNYQYWFDLAEKDRAKYDSEKKRLADEVIDALEERFGGIKSKVEVTDVATPYTTYRYTHNWKASYEGWLPDKKNMMKKIPKKLPGLEHFYMIGQWTAPGGGLPPAAADGRKVAMWLCKNDKKKFRVAD